MQGLWFRTLLAALVVTGCGSDEMSKKHSVALNLDAQPEHAPAQQSDSLGFTLIGVVDQATLPATTSARSIIVALDNPTKVSLKSGPFAITDAYGTDGSAGIQLPLPEGTIETSYILQARVFVDLPVSDVQAPCEVDQKTGVRYCSSTLIVVQKQEDGEFDLYEAVLELDLNGDGTVERLSLFDERLQDILWREDDSGSRRAEVRFYSRPAFASRSSDGYKESCEYDCPKTPSKPKEPDYPKEPTHPKEPDYPESPKPAPKPTPKPTPKPAPNPDCCCDDYKPHKDPRDPDDPD